MSDGAQFHNMSWQVLANEPPHLFELSRQILDRILGLGSLGFEMSIKESNGLLPGIFRRGRVVILARGVSKSMSHIGV